MKILYLAQRLPYPPNRGDRIPTFNHIKRLSVNHEIHIASLIEEKEEMRYTAYLNQWATQVLVARQSGFSAFYGLLLSFFSGKALSLGFFYNPKLKKLISNAVQHEHYDAIVIFSSSMGQYIQQFTDQVRIMNFCDMDSCKWRELSGRVGPVKRFIFKREANTLQKYEKRIAREFDASCMVTPKEAAALSALVPEATVDIVENGVDYPYFSQINRAPEAHHFCFIGVMDYYPNIEAVQWVATHVWPRLREQLPEAQFTIIGSKPTKDVSALNSIPGITVTGAVDDVRPFLAKADLVIIAIDIARGIQNKVLEAMAAGVPVLTTPKTVQGLAPDAQKLVWIEKRDSDKFIHKIKQLQSNKELTLEKAQKAQEFIKAHYTWETRVEKLEQVILNCVSQKAAS